MVRTDTGTTSESAVVGWRAVYALLLAALLLRLLFAFTTDPLATTFRSSGGDSFWLLNSGWALTSGQVMGVHDGIAFDVSRLPTPPLYLLFVGAPQHLVDPVTTVYWVRLVQCIFGAATGYFLFRMGHAIAGPRAGWLALTAWSFHPTYMIESTVLLTETMYILLAMWGLWRYLAWMARPDAPARGWQGLLIGGLFGLATLTRAVLLAFPLLLLAHTLLLIVLGRRRLWRGLSGLIVGCVVVVGAWTAVNLIEYDRLVIGSDQITAVFWRAAVEGDGSPQQNDALLGDDTYAGQAAETISSDPAAYVQRRLAEWGDALLRPYGEWMLRGEALTEGLRGFVQQPSIVTLRRALLDEYGLLKAIIYLLHGISLLGGAVGIWLARRRVALAWPLMLFVLYHLLVHLVLLALPRYFFPMQGVLWVFVGVAVAAARPSPHPEASLTEVA